MSGESGQQDQARDASVLPRSEVPRTLALALALAALFVAIRLVNIDADPPNWMDDCYTRELYAEAPAKSHEARNYALFGKWHVHPVDNYQFWRAQAPIWVYPLTAVFMVFGADYPQLRTYSTVYAAIGVFTALWLIAPYLRRRALIYVGILLAVDKFYFHYARVGFVEPAVSSWIAVSVLALVRARDNLRYLPLAHGAFALAVFTKQAAVVAVPVVLLGTVIALWQRPETEKQRRLRIAVVTFSVLLAIACASYMLTPGYRRALLYNAGHMLEGTDALDHNKWRGLESLLDRIIRPERYWHYWVSLRVGGIIALAVLAGWARQWWRDRSLAPWKLLIACWFLSTVAAMWAIAQSELRFWTTAVMPAALLAGVGFDAVLRFIEGRGWHKVAVAILPLAIAGQLIVHGRGLHRAIFKPTFSLRDAEVELEKFLGDQDVTIVGLASPQVVLGTPYKNYYVRDQFNSTRNALKRLDITYVLLHKGWDPSREVFRREFPGLLRNWPVALKIKFRGQIYNLHPVGNRFDRYKDLPPVAANTSRKP